ncbi:hypothetical protein ANRL4_00027 [Anaerolineae bacterium]|nr:hypothetical protein ANRL4_00027 [Anaerolineae bacterium]
MQTPEEQVRYAQTQRYWERNAAGTCVALVIVVALSAFVRPIGWQLLLGAGGGGVLMFLGIGTSERGCSLMGSVLVVAGMSVAVGAMAVSGVLRGPLMWVQGIGTLFASVFACMVVTKAMHEPSEGECDEKFKL